MLTKKKLSKRAGNAVSPLADEDVSQHRQRLRQSDPKFRGADDALEIPYAIATALIGYRMEHELTQKQLSEVLGITPAEVSRLENGDHVPSVRTLEFVLSKIGKAVAIIDRKPIVDHVRRPKRAATSLR